MSAARNFMIFGSILIIIGVSIGIYMGGSGDTTLRPVHVHINLLGFALSMIFGIVYHLFPAAGGSALARAHFWLHAVGSVVLLSMLWLLMAGKIAEAAMFPLAPIAEAAIWIGLVIFLLNVVRHVR